MLPSIGLERMTDMYSHFRHHSVGNLYSLSQIRVLTRQEQRPGESGGGEIQRDESVLLFFSFLLLTIEEKKIVIGFEFFRALKN